MILSSQRIVCALAVAVAMAAGSTAQAGVLTSSLAAIKGTQAFSGSDPHLGTLTADIDYAVFTPNTYPGTDPSGGSEYVYAYQIFPAAGASLAVSGFTVGVQYDLIAGENISGGHNAGSDPSYPGAGGTAPLFVSLGPTDSQFLAYFAPGLASPAYSDIVLFTSPNAPTWLPASIYNGGVSDQHDLPTPTVPEPASLGLLALGGLGLLARRR